MDHGERNQPSGNYATWEDIMHLPENLGAEIVGGRVHYKAMPRIRHGDAHDELRRQLPSNRSTVAPLGWWIASEVDVDLRTGSYVRPDLAGWRKEHLPELPDVWPLAVLPDWVCEVLSPSTSAYDRGEKAVAYAEAGVPWYWLVDPAERLVEVRELVAGRWTICGVYTDGAEVALPPFGETVVDITRLFGVPSYAPEVR